MKKSIKYFGIFVGMMIFLSGGIYIGSKLEQYNISIKNVNMSNTTKIALVNLDEGVQYQDKQRNFTNEILQGNSEEYTMTGLEDAKTGTKDGRYSAFVIFPSDFSRNVISINKTPVKSLLKYEISGNLSSEANDIAWQNIMKLKEKLNDDVGYMYISSILGEFHDGQENALKVLSNDSKDKEVLMAISNVDLIAVLDLKEVERLQNNIKDLDIDPDIEQNKKIMENIDLAYKGYLSTSAEQLSNLKKESSNVNINNERLLNVGQSIKNLENEDGSLNYTTKNTDEFLKKFNTKLENNIASISDTIKSLIESQKDDNTKFADDKTKDLDTLLEAIQGNHENIQKDQQTLLSNETEIIIDNHFNDLSFGRIDYPEIEKVVKRVELDEQVHNAVYYIDKVILLELVNYDYTVFITDYNTLLSNIEISRQNDLKFKESLKKYAVSLGKDEHDASNYTLKDYVNDNKNFEIDYPIIDSTKWTDNLLLELGNAISKDSANLIMAQYDALKKSITNNIKKPPNTNVLIDSEILNLIQKYKGGLSDVPTSNYNDMINKVNDVSSIEIIEVNNKIKLDLSGLTEEQKTNKALLINELKIHSQINSTFHENLTTYDPLSFINQREIESFVRDYDKNNTDTKFKIEGKNREYTTFVSDSYRNANEQVSSMKNDVNKYQKESDKKVTSGLDNAKKVRTTTSSKNNALMNNYINKLPYTKVGTIGNTTVYDFVTAPTDMEGIKIANSLHSDGMNYLIWFVIATSGLTIGWGCAYIFFKCRQRKQKN